MSAVSEPGVEVWEGVLEVGSAKLRLVLKLTPTTAALVSRSSTEDQQKLNLLVDSVTREGLALRLEMKAVGAVYEGSFSENSGQISGQWQQHGKLWPLTFRRA